MAEDNDVPPNPSPRSDHKVAGPLNIPKLKDAKSAGTNSSESCTLILTGGNSARKFARGLGKEYGAFPLKGNKLPNVRGATPQQLLENTEIRNIMNILGLQFGKIYENSKELRYGHLMIMARKDDDDIHMIGLLINFLHCFWPSLLKLNGFMRVFITPLFTASYKKDAMLLFYTLPEFNAWVKKLGKKKVTEYKLHSYQGPEAFETEEAKYYHQHIKDFFWVDDEDGDAIKIAFTKELNWQRSFWLQLGPTQVNGLKFPSLLQHSNKGDMTQSKEERIRYKDFINKDFKQYVVADLQRSIPSMMDGLKPDQRKVLFYAFKRPIIEKIHVPQFSAYVYEQSPNCHHREVSLVGTIISMAQNYVGSNNINLLQPNGHFGTRLMGGKDHVKSGRCLFTQLSPITSDIFQDIFHEDDKFFHNDIPAWLIPIIPMVLVNGSEGRGTECSSFVPKYNPRVIIANLKGLIEGAKVVPMLPWYKGFKGDVVKSKGTFYMKGIIKPGIIEEDTRTFTITELPVGTCSQDYKEFLKTASQDGIIKAYEAPSYCTDFEVTMTQDQIKSADQEGGLLKKLKLTTELNIENLYLLDERGILKKYDSPEEILEAFYYSCLELYEERKEALIRKHKIALRLLENKEKFIGKVLNQEILLVPSVENDQRWVELKKKDFQSLPSIERAVDGATVNEEEKQEPGGYDYLLSTPIESFTHEKKELNKETEEKKIKIRELSLAQSKSLWLKDLEALDRKLLDDGTYRHPLAERRALLKQRKFEELERANKKPRL